MIIPETNYKHNLRLIKEILDGQWATILTILMVQTISGLSPAAVAWLISQLIDFLSTINSNSTSLRNYYTIIICSSILLILNDFCTVLHHFCSDYFKDLIYNRIQIKLLKSVSLTSDNTIFESPEANNLITLAKQNANTFCDCVSTMSQLIVVSVNVFAALILGLSISWWIPIVLLISMLPFIYFRTTIENNTWNVKKNYSHIFSKLVLYDKILTEPEFSKEIRLYSMQDTLLRRWDDLYKSFFKLINIVRIKGIMTVGGWAILGGLGVFITFWYSVESAVKGDITIGKLSLLLSIIIQLTGSLTAIMYSTSDVLQSILMMKPLVRLTNITGTPVSIAKQNLIKYISSKQLPLLLLDKVSFQYPGSTESAISDISITINQGESIAIVGGNGSGKSTLIKLLCRFYKPTKGRIYWQGRNIDSIDFNTYRANIITLFQDFALFPLSVRDNISIFQEQNDESIKQILEDVDLKFLADKLNSTLHKGVEKGISLSGGQGQRLALARILANIHNKHFLILDEPTSALDAFTEDKIISLIAKMIKTRTSLIISHRLALCKFTDTILVMNQGKIIEQGSHDTLIEAKKSYYNMFIKQAKYYSV